LASHRSGELVVAVVSGAIDASNAHRFDGYLRRLQGSNDLVVELLDVTRCERAGITALKAAQKRADQAGYGFGIVADRRGPCFAALQEDRLARRIRTFSNRHGAREAMQRVRSGG
jgi:hypothetical protein